MRDMTIIYYTANKLSDYFHQNTQANLIKVSQGIPIISVSQKPMDLGKNICVGDIGQTYLNIYRQSLIGAKSATTQYIATAEDDVLYSPDHFSYRPTKGVFAYNINIQSIYTWGRPPVFSHKDRRAFHSLIVERRLFIEAMEERFAKYPDDNMVELKNWSEPGKYEQHLGVTVRPTEKFYSKIPNVVFSHPEAFGFGHLGTRKKIGHDPVEEIEYWGTASKILELYA